MSAPDRSPWNDARSYLGDALQACAATPSGLSRFASSCLHRIAIAYSCVREHLPAATLGFLAGLMATVGLAYIWSWFL